MAKGKGLIVAGGVLLALLAAGGAAAAEKTDVVLPPIPDNEEDRDQVIRTMCACIFELLEQGDSAPQEAVIECALSELFPTVSWPPGPDSHQSHHDWWNYAISLVPMAAEFCAQFPPPPIPDDGENGADFDEQPLYEPSDTTCFRDGLPYNVAQFPDPAAVSSALIELGFPVTITELYKSDANAQTPLWQGSEGFEPAISRGLQAFQGAAFDEGIELVGSADGVIGECTINGISEALVRKDQGNWPHAPGRATLQKAQIG
jgi:hypothetical protein